MQLVKNVIWWPLVDMASKIILTHLHMISPDQAIEAQEPNVRIKGRSKVASSITFQTLFKYYSKLAGMTVRRWEDFGCLALRHLGLQAKCTCHCLPSLLPPYMMEHPCTIENGSLQPIPAIVIGLC